MCFFNMHRLPTTVQRSPRTLAKCNARRAWMTMWITLLGSIFHFGLNATLDGCCCCCFFFCHGSEKCTCLAFALQPIDPSVNAHKYTAKRKNDSIKNICVLSESPVWRICCVNWTLAVLSFSFLSCIWSGKKLFGKGFCDYKYIFMKRFSENTH